MLPPFGKELILDVHECDFRALTKDSVSNYFKSLCEVIDMEPVQEHYWVFDGEEQKHPGLSHLKGISAVQFIKTSSILIHTVEELQRVYVNIFSCKDFDEEQAERFTLNYFTGRLKHRSVTERV